MSDEWLEIPDEDISADEIISRVRMRAQRRGIPPVPEGAESPAAVAHALWQEMFAGPAEDAFPIQPRDCDIVPRDYAIDWRVPILGPIHAFIRRLINAEVRRYLSSSLEKQSYLNREMLRLLNDLSEENKRLRRKIEDLRDGRD